ncbi:hypothetical protein B0T16DRAFT_401846 [Cercophora newfieldiana]|uniref:Uncharacterized protein n=1 Tax=Cercophora newfieldiana TaxID=92897 RepID=A0AA39YT69_9PEZI|nr:hypothetical protein B0T16DRAFT_401846 [Cercophora newfieldiana]
MDMDEDEDEEDGDEDDGVSDEDVDEGTIEVPISENPPEPEGEAYEEGGFALGEDTTHQHPQGQQQTHQGFPRMARLRCNLTTMSQRYNLYFAAYQDKIYVFQPKKAPQILPPPSLILSPRKTKVAKMLGGSIDRNFPHQMNSITVGNLGNLEVVFFAFDDGDVGAYYTHLIARFIRANTNRDGGAPGRPTPPREFFHDNVGLSAWGLAIHEQSRLLAVSSNRHEVTVFAFAMNDNPKKSCLLEHDDSPKVWSGQTALELEKHFQSRTRTWRILLPAGPEGRNMPSIAFCDDESGYADKVVAIDIDGNTWIFDIWKVGSHPILYPPNPTRGLVNHRYIGWSVLVLPDSSFKHTGSLSESLGVPPSEIIRSTSTGRPGVSSPDSEAWLDTTCSLFYVRDLAPNPVDFIRQRQMGGPYMRAHEGLHTTADGSLGEEVEMPDEEDEDWSDMMESDSDDADDSNETQGRPRCGTPPIQDARWAALINHRGPEGSAISDISSEVHLGRAIIPSFGQTPPLDGSASGLITFANDSLTRTHNTKSIRFQHAKFPPFIAKNMTMLRTQCTDVELQPFDPHGTGVICKSVLTHHNHHNRRNEPWDLARHYSERVSMLLHVPELNLVVAGAMHGRVALLTLTKTSRSIHGVSVRRGFRVDWVLPRRSDEVKRVRPLCALHGIAMSPVPDPKARGLDLHGKHGRLPPVWYRLILHYVDHTILMYDICRQMGDEDLMIF